MTLSPHQWLADQQDQLIDTLKIWCNINSGSHHAEGVTQMANVIGDYVQKAFDCDVTLTPLSPSVQINDEGCKTERAIGPLLSVQKRPDAKTQILFCGHMDTVFPKTSPFQHWHEIDNQTLGGPGVADMKGGILVMLAALQAFEQTPAAQNIGWQILLNSDEEIGSLSSAQLLTEAAQNSHLGMIYEPSMPDGWLAGARRGSGNFSLIVHGKAAHAGREYHLGANAIAALASAMQELDRLNSLRDTITLNLARILGGGPNNVVPDLAICHFNIRTTSLDDQAFAEQHVNQVVKQLATMSGFSVDLHGGFTRPPKPATKQQEKLFELVKQCGSELNIDLGFRATGGCCDGNNLLAAGLPNIDTLGVRGNKIHSDQEYMHMPSIVERAQLSHLILQTVAQEPSHWLI